ncbi:MAG: leucine--tRNA ligase [Candidatus Amoebophilus sp. 36-38]|nr:MAG: leucine--tRNA ligase [Candidatus Amoebophilus sp. 36-38]
MNHYDFKAIEQKWQQYWEEKRTFSTTVDPQKPKYYILDMFPYPSGEGLHVGHPLGYIASDIVARYKRSKGYSVLHPMGFDAFGLPAEQFAIQTGQHPAITTAKNIQRYKQQLQQLGLSYDWDRRISTTDPNYYKWTQWIFLQLFESWYDTNLQKARPIKALITIFEQHGNQQVQASCDKDVPLFTAQAWQQMDESTRQQRLLGYRLAFLEDTTVNWCPELGTVLANEEVKDGLSERGGYPVIRKQMKQWSLRITAYANRLLDGLDRIKWPLSTKEMQRNWIGKSVGAEVVFKTTTKDQAYTISIFTTRPDTIFGVTYLVLSPEHALAKTIGTNAQQTSIEAYITQAANRSDRDRLADVTHVTGAFTGAYAIHPFTKKPLPIWIADYVLGGYGTGAVMGVPAHDSRDYAFAKHFNLPIVSVIAGTNTTQGAYEEKEGVLINSDFLDGLPVQEAIQQIIQKLEELEIGKQKTSYRLRNAIFSRQRYWGEPFPIYYKNGIPYPLPVEELPLELPAMATYKPTSTGEPPLGNAPNWETKAGYPLELSTMPGWAGSSWYFFRYMDPHNHSNFVGKTAQSYWKAVDLYLGGAEHATGHLLYARFWTKFLYDLGYVRVEEPFEELIHQGMIQNKSSFVYRIKGTNQFVSHNLRHAYDTISMHVDIHLVKNDVLDLERFKNWRPDLHDASFILENGQYICDSEIEKMSKSKYNTINPDTVVAQYGADTLRLYTMFLGPLEQAKPWDMHGIEGVFRFLVKVWRLFYSETGPKALTNETPSKEALKVIHKAIKKVEEDIKRYTFNTAVSNLMICVNELTALKCSNQTILKNLVLILAPFAPHLAEELWQLLGYTHGVIAEPFPQYEEAYVQEEVYEYPIAINGKVRAKITFDAHTPQLEIEKRVLAHEALQKWIQGQSIKKIIIVPNKMVNIVV